AEERKREGNVRGAQLTNGQAHRCAEAVPESIAPPQKATQAAAQISGVGSRTHESIRSARKQAEKEHPYPAMSLRTSSLPFVITDPSKSFTTACDASSPCPRPFVIATATPGICTASASMYPSTARSTKSRGMSVPVV